MGYTTIITEGGLLPADLLDSIASDDALRQRADEFGLEKNRRLSDVIAATWGEVRAYWDATQRSAARLRPSDSTTRITRERWIGPLLDALGYTDLTYMPTAARVEQRTYAISHRAGADESAPPVHIEGFGVELDRRPPSGRPRLSPHGLVQEYLNSTEHLWGIVTNGERLRLLRDSSQISRPRYVEFDLRGMLEGEKFSEFALLYRLLHRSRLPRTDADGKDALLERYHQQAIERGGRVREGLREGVETALKELGTGLLQHPRNAALREKIAGGQLKELDFYRQLLRLVYRLLFLMVAEERGLIAVSEDEHDVLSPLHHRASRDQRLRIYLDHYSAGRLRRLAEQPGAGRAPYDDLWLSLQTTFRLLEGSDEQGAQLLGLAPLNGDLFGEYAIHDLIETQLRNTALLAAIRALSLYRDQQSKVWRRVNYSALDVEELGSVYESLLDYRPLIKPIGGDGPLSFDLVTGTERKTTGSYYTRPELVQELIKSALEPVIADRLAGATTTEAREQALLGITVCDPACGSGAFLLAAARRIGRELARVRSGEEQPTPSEFRRATRDVIAHCIYGVDLNPLAVDLCKLGLWIEGHSRGMPLSFLDHHIKWGNSLVGATRELVQAGIPDDAYKPVTGDEKAVATAIRKRNKQEREAWQKMRAVQDSLFDQAEERNYAGRARAQRELEALPDVSVQAVRAKAERYQRLRAEDAPEYTLFNLWTAAFFQPLTSANAATIPTTRTLLDHQRSPKPFDDPMVLQAKIIEDEVRFFHYELEFPAVFERGGFDVVLGNPPWERTAFEDISFFASRSREILLAETTAKRKLEIARLKEREPLLYQEYILARRAAECEGFYFGGSGRYVYGASGRINTYALFLDLGLAIINSSARAGMIIQTGIATDTPMVSFWNYLITNQLLISILDFENRKRLFEDVHQEQRFALLTISGSSIPKEQGVRGGFWLIDPKQLDDPNYVYYLPIDALSTINPVTRQTPTCRTKYDFDLVLKIHGNSSILTSDTGSSQPARAWRAIMTAGMSEEFKPLTELSSGTVQSNGVIESDNSIYQPLIESKQIHQFDFAFATYSGTSVDERRKGEPRLSEIGERNNLFFPLPRFWIKQSKVDEMYQAKNWRYSWTGGYRDVTNANNERTAIACILPRVGLLQPLNGVSFADPHTALLSVATINSWVVDYVARQKISGRHLNVTTFSQLPYPHFDPYWLKYLVLCNTLELTYTTDHLQDFAINCGYRGAPFIWNDDRRRMLRCELDAAFFLFFHLTLQELDYIMDTFIVARKREEQRHGEYLTKRLVKQYYEQIQASLQTDTTYSPVSTVSLS